MEKFKPASFWKLKIDEEKIALVTPFDKFDQSTPNESFSSSESEGESELWADW